MRTYCLFVFLFFSFAAAGQSKKEKKLIKTYRVKSVTENVTELQNGKEISRKDSYTVYDKDANIVLNEEYRKDGTLKHKETAKYDSKGNKTEETVFDAAGLQPDPEKYEKHICQYDGEGNKTEDAEYDASGKLIRKTQYSYSSNGDKVLEAAFDASGKLVRKLVYIYNAKGLKVQKKEYDGANVLLSDRKYQYEF